MMKGLSVGTIFIISMVVSSQATMAEEDSSKQYRESITNTELSEDEFLKAFNLPPIDDPKEKEIRAKALKQHQQEVLENNKAYQAGEKSWLEGINEFSDIPLEKFLSTHTGLIESDQKAESERFYDSYRYSRQAVPPSYNSVSLGHVSPVKNQGGCGSCVAFATMALVETCFKKIVGKFGDYSEQHLLDCAYGSPGVYGCSGAHSYGYINWLDSNKPKLASEADYPYKGKRESCRDDYKEFNQGAKISGVYYTNRGDEETLKKLVVDHGAVYTALMVTGSFSRYKSGIYAGCSEGERRLNHAVAIVGYGTENGVDYWLVKNSWGESWGDRGYIKIQRGVSMCGIGSHHVTVSCQATEDKCKGGTKDWSCCTVERPCGAGLGDCDRDSECAPGLKCGRDNCRDFWKDAHPVADCCMAEPARGKNDVHVLFSLCEGCDGFEIVIGGWGNQYSVIRSYKQEGDKALATQTPNILSPTDMRSFWIEFHADGNKLEVKVGKENEKSFMSRSWDVNPASSWPPKYVGFAGWNGKIEYKFCDSGCPSGWERFQDHCYIYVRSIRNWESARQYCRSYQADLVSINSRDENNFVANLVLKSGRSWFWIGGFRDENNLNSFRWTDGTPMTFTSWNSGEPNNNGGSSNNYNERCVMSGWGKPENWNDSTCPVEGTFVCEK